MSLLPPEEGSEYPDRKTMVTALLDHAKANEYAIVVKRSSTKDGTAYLGCDRGGHYRARYGINDSNRTRDTSSHLIGCPFLIRACVKNNIWSFKVRNPDHNHEASTSAVAHPIHRRLPFELRNQIHEMSSAGIRPREIITTIRQATDHPILQEDVLNTRKRLQLILLNGKTPIESLVDVLSTGDYKFDYQTDAKGHITHLFFAHPRSIELLHQYPEVLLLDCTYRTNKFKMPLLNIVGSTCMDRNFYVAFAFLVKEEEADYVWALKQLQSLLPDGYQPGVMLMDREMALMNSIQTVFPRTQRILCAWHIQKNVLVHASRFFDQEESRLEFLRAWMELVSSSIPEAYEERWTYFQERYDNIVPELVSYLQDTWLTLWKRLFVHAYIDHYPHFGNRVTSRVEGAHSQLKSSLQVSTGDLKAVYEKITLLLQNQHAEHDGMVAKNKSRIPHSVNDSFYSHLVSRISSFALGKIWEQRYWLTSPEPLPACTRSFMDSMGLPCAHRIQERLALGQVLELQDIHRYWHFLPQVPLVMQPLILDPQITQTRGRPAASKRSGHRKPNRALQTRQALSSTRREPYAFELVERPKTLTRRSERTRK